MKTRPRRIAIYRYRPRWPVPEYLPAWGTLEAIANIGGCIPMRPTERHVDASLLDDDGFLPYDLSSQELDDLQNTTKVHRLG